MHIQTTWRCDAKTFSCLKAYSHLTHHRVKRTGKKN